MSSHREQALLAVIIRNSLAIKSKGGFCRGRIYPTRGFDESNPYNR